MALAITGGTCTPRSICIVYCSWFSGLKVLLPFQNLKKTPHPNKDTLRIQIYPKNLGFPPQKNPMTWGWDLLEPSILREIGRKMWIRKSGQSRVGFVKFPLAEAHVMSSFFRILGLVRLGVVNILLTA